MGNDHSDSFSVDYSMYRILPVHYWNLALIPILMEDISVNCPGLLSLCLGIFVKRVTFTTDGALISFTY